MGVRLVFSRLLGCLLGLAVVDVRANEPGLPDAFRARLEEGVDAGVWQSVAVGMVRDGATSSAFFGHLEGRDGASMDMHSRVELGALSEAYVGLLLADLAVAGKVRLDDSLVQTMPEGFAFVDPSVGACSLQQLATYRSGLPALPPNLFPRSAQDPFADYGADALHALLGHARSAAGTSGVLDHAVLAHALELRTGGDAAALLRTRVIGELGLEHTGFGDDGLVTGHDLGEAVPPWHYAALTPSRGLRSDLDDQLKFAQALLRPGDGPLQQALLLARQARGAAAFGWHVLMVQGDGQEWPLLWNGGSTAGHAAFLGLRMDRQQAVVLLGNTSSDLTSLGLALLTDAAPPILPPRLRRLDPVAAGDYAGLYRFGPKDEVVVRADDGGLAVQRKGQFPLHLVAYDEDAFLFAGADAQITFQRNGARNVESLLLHQGGANLAAPRLSLRAPQLVREQVEPELVQRDACVGDYALGGLVQLRLAPLGAGLSWQLSGGPRHPLVAFGPQRYASIDGALELRCIEAKGAVEALALNLAGGEIEVPRLRWSAAVTASSANPPIHAGDKGGAAEPVQ